MIDKADPTKYTKEELSVFANGIAALANRVIKQWQLDGSPKNAEQSIELWKKISDKACALKGEYSDNKATLNMSHANRVSLSIKTGYFGGD